MRRQQLAATAVALPQMVTLHPIASVAGAALLVVAVVSSTASLVLHTRVAGMFVAAACAGLLDDAAAATLGPSPTSLLTRRVFRVTCAAALAGAWWTIMIIVVVVRSADVPIVALTREFVLLTAIALCAALVVQARTADGRGAAGGIVAVVWFGLSFVPPVGRVPLPPNPLEPGADRAITVAVLGALAVAAALSRDPASRTL
jgi:hypothetical protein